MKRALIFGAGENLKRSYGMLNYLYEIVGIADNSPQKQGDLLWNFKVCALQDAMPLPFDVVIVTPERYEAISKQLVDNGIQKTAILTLNEAFEKAFEGEKVFIAVLYFGGMGDFLIGRNWLYHLREKYGLDNAIVDVFFSGSMVKVGEKAFLGCEFIHGIHSVKTVSDFWILKHYDLKICFCIFPCVFSYFGEKISRLSPKLLEYVLKLQEFGFKNYNLGFFLSPNFYKTARRLFEMEPKNYYSYCDVLGNLEYTEEFLYTLPILKDEVAYLSSIQLQCKRYITLNTGLNRDFRGKNSTRAWPHDYWDKLARMLKNRFPSIKIVQIGEKMDERDDIFADLNMNGKTDIEGAKILLKHALLHIDYDGGLIHVRHILFGGSSVVLFGPSAVERHQYSENINIRTNACPVACEWVTSDWQFQCPKGMKNPVCMYSITPQYVMKVIEEKMITMDN